MKVSLATYRWPTWLGISGPHGRNTQQPHSSDTRRYPCGAIAEDDGRIQVKLPHTLDSAIPNPLSRLHESQP